MAKGKEENILIKGNNKIRYEITSITNVTFAFCLKDIIKRVMSARSAIAISIFVTGSASKKPNINKQPKGS